MLSCSCARLMSYTATGSLEDGELYVEELVAGGYTLSKTLNSALVPY